MKEFILKKNNETYTIRELKSEGLKAHTKIKYVGEKEWKTAGEYEELKEIITLHSSYADIRTSNEPHVRKPTVWELILLGIVVGLIQLLIPIEGDFLGGYTISVSVLTPLKIDAYMLVVFIVFLVYVYNIFTYRYYRLVKLYEENDSGGKTYFQIQTCISLRNSVEKLEKQKLKWWKSEAAFKLTSKKEFKKCFDKLTLKKVSEKKPVTAIKARNKKPTVIEKLRQDNSYVQYICDAEGVILFMILPVGLITVEGLMIFFEYYHDISLTQLSFFFFGSIIFLFLFNRFALWGSNYYLRVVKNETTQGQIQDYNYQLECYISRKNIQELSEVDDDAWVHKVIRKQRPINHGRHNVSYIITGESDLKKIFHKQTNKIYSVSQKAMD